MNAILDRVLVGAALAVSVLHCVGSFGPHRWRRRLWAGAGWLLARIGLRRLARTAASVAGATPGPCAACAGCASARRRSSRSRDPTEGRAGTARSG